MERKTHIDAFGATSLILFATLLAFNQVVIKVTNGGFGPVFAAGLRSVIGLVFLGAWMWWRGIKLPMGRSYVVMGIVSGLVFSLEFILLYISLDLTDVSRASVIFYSMPVWLTLAGHFVLPGEHLNTSRMIGLCLAMGGVVVALSDRQGGHASLLGDLAALGAAMSWAAIVLVVRLGPMSRIKPEAQLMWQLIVSAVVLMSVAPLFGALLRDPQAVHFAGLMFQAVGIVAMAYVFWFWLMTIYPASSVASFSFLSPVFSVLFGWWLLGETVGVQIWLALAMVAVGIILINRRR